MASFALDFEGSSRDEYSETELLADLGRARRLADLLDAEFSVAGIRFGLDAVTGLIPVVGDSLGFFAGLYPIHLVRKHGLGKQVEHRMIANLMIDAVGGMIPVIGDLFDISFKANLKNLVMLERAIENRPRRRSR
ncbi:MAG: DUF4112 domain-containing protein [Anaerolineae bacterium]|nr:DUF4112 domain-containing protein [Phycisphaerae bacterium]